MAWQAIIKGIGGALSGMGGGIKNMNATEAPGTSNKIDDNAEQKLIKQASTLSDENEKSVCEMMPAISDCYKNIEAYIFKYKPDAQHKFHGAFGVDDNPHVGVVAQELQENPATETSVHELDDGTLTVNSGELSMTNAAAIADLSRRLDQLEKTIGER